MKIKIKQSLDDLLTKIRALNRIQLVSAAVFLFLVFILLAVIFQWPIVTALPAALIRKDTLVVGAAISAAIFAWGTGFMPPDKPRPTWEDFNNLRIEMQQNNSQNQEKIKALEDEITKSKNEVSHVKETPTSHVRDLYLADPPQNGPDVQQLQEHLKNLEYDINVDAEFDTNTEIVVKKFQAAQDISDDGIVGPETRRKLMSVTEQR